MILDSQVQIPLDLQAQHPLIVRADWGKPPVFFRPHPLANQSGLKQYVCADASGLVLEEWGFVDERELDSFKGHKSNATCDHFG